MIPAEARIGLWKRPLRAMALTLVEPGKPVMAYAAVGSGRQTRIAVAAYGATDAEALAALEVTAEIMAAKAANAPTPTTRVRNTGDVIKSILLYGTTYMTIRQRKESTDPLWQDRRYSASTVIDGKVRYVFGLTAEEAELKLRKRLADATASRPASHLD